MSITLTYSGTTIILHPDLLWADEHNWSQVEQTAARTITGAIVVEYGTRVAGRPITLQPPAEDAAWMTLATLEALKAWEAVPGREMFLNIRGATRSVVFRHMDGAIEATPIIDYNTPDAADFYRVTLRFMET